jgi:putative PIN family toxin of toxin-antitoxin system
MDADRPKIRAVFDCMMFLQAAARRGGPSAACLQLVEFGVVELYVSREIISEVRDVLARPRVRKKFPAMTDPVVEQFLASITKRAVNVVEVPRLFEFARDPKDEPYINLAIAANARFLVSRDNDILDLATNPGSDGERLRRMAPDLRILDPVAFLIEIRRLFSQGE